VSALCDELYKCTLSTLGALRSEAFTCPSSLAGRPGYWPPDLTLLLLFRSYCVSAAAVGLIGRVPTRREPLLILAASAAAAAIWFLLRFLRSADERERQINYRALTFAFAGTLIFSLFVGLSQAAGFHSISWLGIPILMLILWSIGLILYSLRYR
jgi:hypothetical protein